MKNRFDVGCSNTKRLFFTSLCLSLATTFAMALVSPVVQGLTNNDATSMEQAYRRSLRAATSEPQLRVTPSYAANDSERATVNNTTDGITHCGIASTRTAVWLTFDDSGTTSQVTAILAILKKYNVRATFFPTGEFAAARPDLITLMKNDGHIVGNHSYSHPDLTKLSTSQIRSEITRADAAIKPYPSTRKVFRNPYGAGSFSSTINSILTGYSYQNCFWTVDTQDWAGTSASSMISNVKANTRARGVILMHMHGKYTASALPGIIQYLETTGYGLPRLR